ncbi:MAG TPA: FAD-dependent monooxygenase [Blastocatellia bacterium]|nr:FAD-dependent monooxygenase [Blastocatellia bacterium]
MSAIRKINVIGGGPAGLYFAILMKRQDPSREILVVERDGPDDTFGWGIVFSDQTFSYLEESDQPSFRKIIGACEIWDNVDVVHKGERVTIRGNRFSGIGRLKFLRILRDRCRELGVDLRFGVNVTDVEPYRDCGLMVGADGANSAVRRAYQDFFEPSIDVRKNKYIWLGTNQLFHGLTLTFRENEAGHFIAHSYKFDEATSAFIVECDEATWRNAGFDNKNEAETCAYLQRVFEDDLGGHELLTNNFVRWINFPLVRNQNWRHENIVLLGDALHTAHFSIGSGTKLALEDAIALAKCFAEQSDVTAALREFERTRRPVVEALQDAAFSSLQMLENIAEDWGLEPLPFAYKMMTRSGRITHEKLKRRDPEFVAAYEEWRRGGEENPQSKSPNPQSNVAP